VSNKPSIGNPRIASTLLLVFLAMFRNNRSHILFLLTTSGLLATEEDAGCR